MRWWRLAHGVRAVIALAWLVRLTTSGVSLEDVHNRDLHGPSVRHLFQKMVDSERNGRGTLTDDDTAILFLRYQREFNRTLESGAYTPKSMNAAFRDFQENTRRLAEYMLDPSGPIGRGIEVALNELADVSEDDWLDTGERAKRSLTMQLEYRPGMKDRGIRWGDVNWRQQGLVQPNTLGYSRLLDMMLPAEPNSRYPWLAGLAAAKAACLDALYLRETGGDVPLPAGGFGHIAASGHKMLLESLHGPEPTSQAALVPGLFEFPVRKAKEGWPEHVVRRLAVDNHNHMSYMTPRGFADEELEQGNLTMAEEEKRARTALQFLWDKEIEFRNVPAGDEIQMQVATEKFGPLVVAVDASDSVLQFYRSGTYSAGNRFCGSRTPTHAMLVEGYKQMKDSDHYWLVNSLWGRSWGQGGVAKFLKDKNTCGIATNAIYAVVKDSENAAA